MEFYMTPAQRETRDELSPELIPLTKLQAERLSAITGESLKELYDQRPIDLMERLKWRIDPQLWRYQRVCGRVVKRDPVSGTLYGVPNATVLVEDTDCSFVFYAPKASKFTWLYPFRCRREVIATAHTDACGNFCVWVPRWEIDWVVSWRARRICFPIVFQRPSWRDLIDPLGPVERFPRPIPQPDPSPFARRAMLRVAPEFGGIGTGVDPLDEAAFPDDLHPPLPVELTAVMQSRADKPATGVSNTGTHELVVHSIAERAGVDVKRLDGLDISRVVGPFVRCTTVFVPMWTPIFDVPDITFRVTQDVDGDGTEESIYTESFFQVRWDAASIGNVTLTASSAARESRICDAPPVVPCGNVPAINFAGLMPVSAAYHDNATGYAIRPNRPQPGGVSTSPAHAPYCLNVNLFGCLPRITGAAKYRLVHRYAPKYAVDFGATIPFTNMHWYWHPTGGAPIPADPTPVSGWYDLPPAGLAGTPEESFLFPFDTTQFTPGLYGVTVQLGDGAGAVLASSAEVLFSCDNRAPTILNNVRWSRNGGATWTVLPTDCPVVRRGSTPSDVLFETTWTIMAPAHYRDSNTGASGCGASGGAPVLEPAGQVTSDWHVGPNDNAQAYVQTYRLPATSAEGTYGFSAYAGSRAFNPSGYVAGYQTNDWLFDVGSPPIYNTSQVSFSVFNA